MLRGSVRGLNWRRLLKSDSKTSFGAFQNAFRDEHKQSSERNTGLFAYSELSQGAKPYQKMTDRALADSEKLLQEAFSSRGRGAVVEKLDEVSNTLCKVADLAEFVRFVQADHSDEAEKSVARIASLVATLNTDVKLYELLTEAISGRSTEMDSETLRVGLLLKHDFEQSGIHLEREKREQCVQLNDELLEIGQNFMKGTSMPVAVPRREMNEKMAWMFSDCKDMPGYVEITQPFSEHDDEDIRRVGYLSFFYQEPTQYSLLDTMLMKRTKLAELCGFSNYSQSVSQHSAIGGAENVESFLASLNQKLVPLSSQEFREMQLLKNKEGKADELMPWDCQYYMKKARPHLDSSYKEFFSLPTCLEGLNDLCTRVFDVSLEVEPTVPGEIWHPTVQKLAVCDSNSRELLGYIYCDFFARESKPRSDCHFTIRGGKRLKCGQYQIPIVALLCNFEVKDNPEEPLLLDIGQVENLFHEMGHALHSMVARTRFQHVSGTRCVTDFAEVPSNLLEFFTHDDRVIRSIGKHHSTKETIPEDLLADLRRFRKFGKAADLQHQLMLSAFDHQIHSESRHIEPHSVFKSILFTYYPSVGVDPGSAFYLRFGHLVGYASKYYTYLFCKAISTKIWLDLFESDPYSKISGTAYKRELLSHGGAKEPKAILESLLGANPDIESLTNSLISSL